MLAVRNNNRIFPRLEPLWDDPLTASLAVSVAPPSLKECFSGRRIVFVTGRENDGTGLMFYRARYYSPTLQRFISEDPAGFYGGLNFYRYVRNNPVRYRDSLGLQPGGGDLGLGIAAIIAGSKAVATGVAIASGASLVVGTTGAELAAGVLLLGADAAAAAALAATSAAIVSATGGFLIGQGINALVPYWGEGHLGLDIYDILNPPPLPPAPPPFPPPDPPAPPCGRKC